MDKRNVKAVYYAILAAVFYALNMPFSKILLGNVPPTMMAALLYIGAGTGTGVIYMSDRNGSMDNKLEKSDLPYTLGMIILDILAPVLLMFGLLHTTSANASLLNNFEIVATSLIALVIFKETVSKRLWMAIILITLSSAMLSFEDMSSMKFSWGSLLVLAAALCWGLENNCTRKISSKNTMQIVMLKGIFSGAGSFMIGLVIGERLPEFRYCLMALAVGFVAYGLSILFYVKAQYVLGAAKTSAYYAVAPFAGAFLSFVCLHEPLTKNYLPALFLMLAGTVVVVMDTMILHHIHLHTHTIVHTHDGITHSHTVTHSHEHTHLGHSEQHSHIHGEDLSAHKL